MPALRDRVTLERLAWVVAAGLVGVFALSVLQRRMDCERPQPVGFLQLDAFGHQRLLQSARLWRLFRERGTTLPTHAEIVAERASNYGGLKESADRIVIWQGQLIYIERDETGRVVRADMFVNAAPCIVGDDHVPVSVVRPLDAAVKDGDYALVVGRLIAPDYESFSLGLEAHHIEPLYHDELGTTQRAGSKAPER